MSERELDLKKIKACIGKVTPTQLGKLYRQYAKKYIFLAVTPDPAYADVLKTTLDDYIK